MRLVSIILAFFLVSCGEYTGCGNIVIPPNRYDYRPSVAFSEFVVTPIEVALICHTSPSCTLLVHRVAGDPILTDDVTPVVVLPNTVRWETECYRRHEYGHINGWPADHPGGVYVY